MRRLGSIDFRWTSLVVSKPVPRCLVSLLAATFVILFSVAPSRAQTAAMTIPLDSTEGLKLVNAKVESVSYKSRKAIRVTDDAPEGTSDDGRFVVVTSSQFQDGLIEVDVAGDRIAIAAETNADLSVSHFDWFTMVHLLRLSTFAPLTGALRTSCNAIIRLSTSPLVQRVRRRVWLRERGSWNPLWNRLRQESPGKYETYVDLVPGEWTKMKIEVKGYTARLYVNDAREPTLIVNRLHT